MKVIRKQNVRKVIFGLTMFGVMFLFNTGIKADTTVTTEAGLRKAMTAGKSETIYVASDITMTGGWIEVNGNYRLIASGAEHTIMRGANKEGWMFHVGTYSSVTVGYTGASYNLNIGGNKSANPDFKSSGCFFIEGNSFGAGSLVVTSHGVIRNFRNKDSNAGAAIYNLNGSVTIRNGGTIYGCEGAMGPAIMNSGGTVTISDGFLHSNKADSSLGANDKDSSGNGGAIAMLGGTLNMSGGNIYNNSATNNGGGISIKRGATVTMSGGYIGQYGHGNSSGSEGGGIYVGEGSTFTMTGGVIGGSGNGNSSGEEGGGIFSSGGTTKCYIRSAEISYNTASGSGGGIFSGYGAELQVGRHGNSTVGNGPVIAHNTSSVSGGGIRANGGGNNESDRGGTTTIYGALIDGNTANGTYGGGISVQDSVGGGSIFSMSYTRVTNNYVANSTGSGNSIGGGVSIKNNDNGNGTAVPTFSNNQIYYNSSYGSAGGLHTQASMNIKDTSFINIPEGGATGNAAQNGNGGNVLIQSVSNRYGIEVKMDSTVSMARGYSNGNGGSICMSGSGTGTLTLNGTNVLYNLATGNGGGIYVSGIYNTLTINSASVNYNTAGYNTTTGNGGGIWCEGNLQINGNASGLSYVSANNAPENGGAIYTRGSSKINYTHMDSNTAGRNGGGIYTTKSDKSAGSTELNTVSFTIDHARNGHGGAVAYETGTTGLMYNCVAGANGNAAANCTATSSGGAVFNNGTLREMNINVYHSTASQMGGAIYNGGTVRSLLRGQVIGCSVSGQGGAIANTGTIERLTLVSSSSNSVTGTENRQGLGGAIYNSGKINEIVGEGNLVANTASTYGGGIYNSGTINKINEQQISYSTAVNGGGIYNEGKIGSITGIINNNVATVNGGGIYNKSKIDYESSEISANSSGTLGGGICNTEGGNIGYRENVAENGIANMVHDNTSGYGGGIFTNGSGSLYVNGAKIYNNIANENAGAISSGGNAYIYSASIYHNTAKIVGGAIVNEATANGQNYMMIESCTIYNNSVSDDDGMGGAIYNVGNNLTIRSSNMYGNQAIQKGGAICNDGSAVINYIFNTTVHENRSNNGAGIYNSGNAGGMARIGTLNAQINNNAYVNNNSDSYGGGLYNGGYVEIVSSDVMQRNEFGNNNATYGAGMYLNYNSRTYFNGMTYVDGNTAVAEGGGIYITENSGVTSSYSDAQAVTIIHNNAANAGGVYQDTNKKKDGGSLVSLKANIGFNTSTAGSTAGYYNKNGSCEIGGKVYNNIQTNNGAVLINDTCKVADIGLEIYVNKTNANNSVPGLEISKGATFECNYNLISWNNVIKGSISSDAGLGISNAGTFKMNGGTLAVYGNYASYYGISTGVQFGSKKDSSTTISNTRFEFGRETTTDDAVAPTGILASGDINILNATGYVRALGAAFIRPANNVSGAVVISGENDSHLRLESVRGLNSVVSNLGKDDALNGLNISYCDIYSEADICYSGIENYAKLTISGCKIDGRKQKFDLATKEFSKINDETLGLLNGVVTYGATIFEKNSDTESIVEYCAKKGIWSRSSKNFNNTLAFHRDTIAHNNDCGIYLQKTTMTTNHKEFKVLNNKASLDGAGIYIDSGSYAILTANAGTAEAMLTPNYFSGNKAGRNGDAIYVNTDGRLWIGGIFSINTDNDVYLSEDTYVRLLLRLTDGIEPYQYLDRMKITPSDRGEKSQLGRVVARVEKVDGSGKTGESELYYNTEIKASCYGEAERQDEVVYKKFSLSDKFKSYHTVSNKYTLRSAEHVKSDIKTEYKLADKDIIISEKYKLKYNKNTNDEVSNMPKDDNKFWNETIKITKEVPSRENYEFDKKLSWNTEKTGKGTAFNGGVDFDENSDTTLYAIWNGNKTNVTVHYFLMNKKGEYEEKEKIYDSLNIGDTVSVSTYYKDDKYSEKGVTYNDRKVHTINGSQCSEAKVTEDTQINIYYAREKHRVTLRTSEGIGTVKLTDENKKTRSGSQLIAREVYASSVKDKDPIKVTADAILKNGYTFNNWKITDTSMIYTINQKEEIAVYNEDIDITATAKKDGGETPSNPDGGTPTLIVNHYVMNTDGGYSNIPTKQDIVSDVKSNDTITPYKYMDEGLEVSCKTSYDSNKLTKVVHFDNAQCDGVTYDKTKTLTLSKNKMYVVNIYYLREKCTVKLYGDDNINTITAISEKYTVDDYSTRMIPEIKTYFGATLHFDAEAKTTGDGYHYTSPIWKYGTYNNEKETVCVSSKFDYDVEYFISEFVATTDYEPIHYTVVYHSNEPYGVVTGTMEDSVYTYNVRGKLRKNTFKHDTLKFIGWNTKKDGKGTSYVDENEVYNWSDKNGDVINLYAMWKPNEDDDIPYPHISVKDQYYEVGTTLTINDILGEIKVSDGYGDLIDNDLAELGIVRIVWDVDEDGEVDANDVPVFPADSVNSFSDTNLSKGLVSRYLTTDCEKNFLVTVQAHNYNYATDEIGHYAKEQFSVTIYRLKNIKGYVRSITLDTLNTIDPDSKWATGAYYAELVKGLMKGNHVADKATGYTSLQAQSDNYAEAEAIYRFTDKEVEEIKEHDSKYGFSAEWFGNHFSPVYENRDDE